MTNGNGVSRGDRNRNARLARLQFETGAAALTAPAEAAQ